MKKMSRPTANHNWLKLLVLIAHLKQILRSKYTNSAVVITGWLTVTKYPHIKCQWILSLLPRFFLSFITDMTFIRNDLMSSTAGAL